MAAGPIEKTVMPEIEEVNRLAFVPTILDVVCRTTGMGFAAIARVTEHRWIACAVKDEISFGLRPGGELDVKTTICDEIRASSTPVVIDDVTTDPVYCGHPTAALYGFKSYISMPIFRDDGSFFGTLCAIDPKPAHVTRPEVVGMFRLFADLIGHHLDSGDRLAESERRLAEQTKLHELRDQFIAVLGHDLRNPLAAIQAGVRHLQRTNLDDGARTTATLIDASVRRMAELIQNVLDFARGRLGTGLLVSPGLDVDVAPTLRQVVSELQQAWPERTIRAGLDVAHVVNCDAGRIGQLLSNLIANALTHGTRNGPVDVAAASDPQRFTITVSNQGEIPSDAVDQLFEPFTRSRAEGSQEGLGLGLYICAEIAKAHGGSLTARSDAGTTTFTFQMPTRSAN